MLAKKRLLFELAAIALVVASQSAAAQRAYVRKELYPAQVRSITFPRGGVLNATSPVVHSIWKVEFSTPQPNVVYYDDDDGDGAAQIEIVDLICTSEGSGTQDCAIAIPGDEKACILFIDASAGAPEDFARIPCPVTLDLVE